MSAITDKNLPLLTQAANELRYLCADIVQRANSGHPGAPMGLAEVAIVLSHHLRLNPKNPRYLNRDRLVFSGGHASALVYSLLHLWGFDVSMQDLQAFRQLDSLTPGHPEFAHTPGVEITTGPLGQGIANAVGFALAQKRANALLDSSASVLDHYVYCLCGDGDLQEGISYEACSLAGLHKLENLIIIYDSNGITIEGDTKIAFSENVRARFEAQGFSVFECDGHDLLAIDSALESAKASPKPSLIIAHTTIGKGALELEGSHKTHGAPLGAELIAKAREQAGISKQSFSISDEVAFLLRTCMEKGASLEALWEQGLSAQAKSMLESLSAPIASKLDSISYPTFTQGDSLATRVSNGKILNALSKALPNFIGGSADLAPSNNTTLLDSSDFPSGNNLHFGIREHSMGAICNAFANYGLFLPFCATFFVFSDYMSASVRIASIMRAKVFYIFTHDSIGVGEDGATHQPIEQLSHFRAMPNLLLFRPADANENIACWQVALESSAPSAFVLSRQNLPVLEPVAKAQAQRGAYIKQDSSLESSAQITLLASGSEVSLCLQAQELLESSGVATRVVSMPCFELLCEQDSSYHKELFAGKVLAVEAARGNELYRFADSVLGIQSFGKSAKGEELFAHFGLSAENIAKIAKDLAKESLC
ncbi:transketolase [Helicobacter canis]|uniref:Transketolase n=1 Tax=Helicobacter canis NCTC 12740 TaxID=1357399 RepID=V8CI23_9HELI|nr:transketolase [Helicobacter canis]ETD26747.1 transketolase [Helicobacter canis NCTC 12740]